MKKEENKAKHRISYYIYKYNRLRKIKERDLPVWKAKWNAFNEKRFLWLEKFVDRAIPWAVIILLFIILGEFADYINIFKWSWVHSIALFFESNLIYIELIDRIVVGLFMIDLYFNFFKKRTILSFLKTSIIDLIAIAPIGLIFRLAGIQETQSALHVLEVESSNIAVREEAVSSLLRTEQRLARLEKIPRVTRILRLNRLTQFAKKKKKR